MSWNPIRKIHDSLHRKKIKSELLAIMDRTKKAGEGFSIENDDGTLTPVIEEILRERPEFSLTVWLSGPAIVRTSDVDALEGVIRETNISAGFIHRGGQDFNMDLVKPTPTGGANVSQQEYDEEVGNLIREKKATGEIV